MKKLLLATALAALFSHNALAGTAIITVKDAGGVTRNVVVTTTTDITGNLSWNNVICDQATGTPCASVGTAGSPSTNALTVQAVTLGHGTAANAMRVELPTDGTGQVVATQSTAANFNATVQGTGAQDAAVAGNPFRIGLSDNTNTKAWFTALSSLLTDGVNGNNIATVAPWVWNGATWDRMPGTAANGIKAVVTQPSAAALNATVVGTGTFLVQAAQAVAGNLNMTEANSTNILNAVSAGTATLQGAASTSGIQAGCFADSGGTQTAATTGQIQGVICDLNGKLVITPYASRGKQSRNGGSTTTGSAITFIAASVTGDKGYVTDWECSNTSATTVIITLTDSATTKIIVPAGGGNNKHLGVPLVSSAANTVMTGTPDGGSLSTIYCYAQGYFGI